jgi:hypothetical protein
VVTFIPCFGLTKEEVKTEHAFTYRGTLKKHGHGRGWQVGLGTVVLNYFSGLLSTVLMELGFGEDMFSPVCSQTLSYDIRFCELGQFACGMPAALSGTYYF